MRHVCFTSSRARPMPRSFALKRAEVSELTAVMTKTLSPHTTGLACERPGMAVRHKTFSDFAAFQLTGVRLAPVATPEAFTPRNCGQFCACDADAKTRRQRMV